MTTSYADKSWPVERGFNLYIDVSTACNAACPFCIAETKDRKDTPEFWTGLTQALNFTERVGGSVQIVGGEPAISKRLPRLLSEIGSRKFHRIVFTTNGTGLDDDLARRLKSVGVTHVNVSRHHQDDDKNQEVMKFKNRQVIAGDIQVAVLACSKVSLPMRLNCQLIPGYIDNLANIEQYMAWGMDVGCFEFSFSQTFPLSQLSYSKPLVDGWADNAQVDLRAFSLEIAASGRYRAATWDAEVEQCSIWGQSAYGSGSRRRFWQGPQGEKFSLKTFFGFDQEGLPIVGQYDKNTDPELQEGSLAFMVLHPDGVVSASWDQNERVLFSSKLIGAC